MHTVSSFVFLCVVVVLLAGCESWNPYAAVPAPDMRIRLVKDANGHVVALPPVCPDWRTANPGPFQNEPWPQYGCANTRNLATMVERPEDLEEGRQVSAALGSDAAVKMRRYNLEKTMPLIDPSAKAPASNAGAALGADSEGSGGMTGK